MTISYQWLMQYLPEPIPVEELSKILTSIGLEVEHIEVSEKVKGSLEGLVIGEVLTCAKHPNADKLHVTTVNIGNEEPLHIVCGAPNVAAGQKVVIAPIGTTVYPTNGEPFLIKKAKIRGEESQGMICAEDEIGLGSSHAGIMILPEDAPVGTPAKTYFNISGADQSIHIGLTPNRSDAMSHIGVAKDVCAYLSHHQGGKHEVQYPAVALPEPKEELHIQVHIDAPEACKRYAGISITGVKVGASPEWLQERLKAIGLRSINNVVDITNFVLHEYGQPLHAFDADKIKNKEVHVRFLPQNTVFKTLDGKEIKLNADDLMICDASEGMCIAGVFGGAGSGVSDHTTSIFLESAYFHPTYVRRTSMYHGLRTDAATHFEKGVDINNVLPALRRAAALITELCGGNIASAIIDVYPHPLEAVRVPVTYEYIWKLSGKRYEEKAIRDILAALGFILENVTENGFTVIVPSNKTDVLQQADIVEEILRIDGLDNIEIPGQLHIALTRSLPNDREEKEKIAQLLCGKGFQEIITNSITNSKYYPGQTDLVVMLNSLSSELDVMRPSMLESGLEVIQHNCNRKNNDLSLFQFGNVYTRADDGYKEKAELGLYVTGNTVAPQWNQQARPADLFFLKGIVENMLAKSGITATTDYEGTQVIWKWKNQVICTADHVDEQKLKAFDIKQAVWYAVVQWEIWQKAMKANKIKYNEVPKFPAVQRDLAIILDKNVTYQQVAQATEQLKIGSLKGFGLFDVFESEKLGADKKSYALSYTFQLQDRTLTDTEIEQVMQQLMDIYKTKLQAQIRE